MSFLDNIVNECDIALKTLSNKKTGTDRVLPSQISGRQYRKTYQTRKKSFDPAYEN